MLLHSPLTVVALLHPPALPRCRAPRCCANGAADMQLTLSPADEIRLTTAAEPVVIYSKSWCPYCEECKALFDALEQPYTAIELDQRDDGVQMQEALLSLTQQRTVPNVFVGGQHLGGNDDTQLAAATGRLAERLADTGRVLSADNKGLALAESAAEKLATRRRVNLGLAVASPLLASVLFFGRRSFAVDPIALLGRMEEQSPSLPAALANGRYPVRGSGTLGRGPRSPRTPPLLTRAPRRDRPTVVEFYAPWCESCKQAAPCMYRLEKRYTEQLNFVVINGNDARNAELVQRFGVDGIPHLALISAQRKLVGTLIGGVPNAVLEQNMEALAAGSALPYASTNAERGS